MIRTISIILFLSWTSIVMSQETAVTESGDTVYLYSNGRWTYDLIDIEDVPLDDELVLFSSYPVMDSTNTVYNTPKNSKKIINNEDKPYSIAYDVSRWRREPTASINEEADYTFMSKNEENFAMIIYEEAEIGLNAILNIAMSNLKSGINVEPNVIHSDYVMVNGKQMIHATYAVEIEGMNFVFDSFFYSGEEGTYQYTTWTFANIHKKYQKDHLELLAGLTVK